MKRKLSAVMLSFVCFSTLFAWDGTIKMNHTNLENKDANGQLIWHFSGEKCRLDIVSTVQGKSITTCFLPNLEKQTLQIWTQEEVKEKVFFEVPVAGIKEIFLGQISIKNLTEEKEIGGAKCEKMIAESEQNVSEFWCARSISVDWKKWMPFFKNQVAIQALGKNNWTGFPLEISTKNNRGLIVETDKTTEIKASALPENLFTIPVEYRLAK